MPIEKRPRHPLPTNYKPPKSVSYQVKDGDTWINVAQRYNLNVQELIYFNFHTNDPDEVNWYLNWYTGCNVTTADNFNWEFSSSAKPGIIYLPVKQIDVEPLDVPVKKTINPLALEFDGPSSPLDTIGKIFDGFQLLDMGLTIAEVAVGELAMLGIGIVIAPIAPFIVLGGPHEAAINELRKKQILEGLTLGIVLAADGRSMKYINDHGFVKKSPVRDIVYPEWGKQLQDIYNQSLVAGIAHGRQFNTVASKNLFAFLRAQMTDYARSEFSGDSKRWSSRTWEVYYMVCAKILERKIVLR